MEVISLNTNKQKVAIIDSYKSFIWNDRYEDLGDFELYIPANAVELLANIHQDYYIQCSESDRTMIVEKVNYKTDLEDGNFVVISGHSLETILKRRIVWNDDGSITQINATKIVDYDSEDADSGMPFPVWQAIEYLLNLYIIDPETYKNGPQRQIPNFKFLPPSMDDEIYYITMSACSYQGDNLYDVIKSLCDMYEFSFKITLADEDDEDNGIEAGDFVFSLYKGISHLASQMENPYICFSKDFDNLLASDSSLDMSTYKNMAYYKGNGSRYIVREFSGDDLTVEVGYVRIHNNKVYACKTAYDLTPDEFEIDENTGESKSYAVDELVSRTVYGGALLTENKSYYLVTETESGGGEDDDYNYVLLYDSGYDVETKYYRCKVAGKKTRWTPSQWEEVGVKVFWDGFPTYSKYKYDISKAYKEGDYCVKENNGPVYTCTDDIPEATKWSEHKTYRKDDCVVKDGHRYKCKVDKSTLHYWKASEWDSDDWRSDSWIKVYTGNNDYKNIKTKWELCENWVFGKKYAKGVFVTFNDVSRTGKIGVYRKSEADATYSSKSTYSANAVVWYKSKYGENRMYVRKNKSNSKKGINPTNKKYWKKITDKYKTFDAQQWEAVDDIETENYDVYGAVQDTNVGGLNRREMYVDATSVPSTYDYFYNDKSQETANWLVDDGVFRATIKDMALAELTTPANRMTKALEAEIEYATNFKYRKDYNIGDVIEVRDIYGYYDSVRVKEFIISDDDSGIKCYPVFEAVEASTITTRFIEVNDELFENTFLVKIPESTRFVKNELIATSVNNGTTYYLRSFVKKVSVKSEFESGKYAKRDLHIVAWVTSNDVYTHYEKQDADDIIKTHPTIVGEPLFYVDIQKIDNKEMVLPGILFPSWSPPYGVDLGVVSQVNITASQYENILLANI